MIYTSSFHDIKRVLGKYPHICFCSVAGKTPAWVEEYCASNGIPFFKAGQLAPKFEWWKKWHELFSENPDSGESMAYYKKHYEDTVLSRLNPRKTLESLLAASNRLNVCLLCYEPSEKFCHRRLIAEWFRENGIPCQEVAG